MDGIGKYVNSIKAIYKDLVEKGVIKFTADPFSFSVNVDQVAIKTVVDAINLAFGTKDKDGKNIPVISEEDLAKIKDLGLVKIDANTEGYKDKVVIEVKYGDNTYKLEFDGSQDKKFVITFTLTLKSNRSYSVVFNATSGDAQKSWTASVLVDIKDAQGKSVNSTEVTLSNFHAEWGNDNSDEVEALIPTDAQKVAASEIFPTDGTGPATKLVEGILDILSGDTVYEKAVKYGKMIVDMYRAEITEWVKSLAQPK